MLMYTEQQTGLGTPWMPWKLTATYRYTAIAVVPHKAVAEVSKIGNQKRRGWLLWITNGRAKPLMDRKVIDVSSLSLSLFLWLSTYLPTDLSIYLPIYLFFCLSMYLSIYLSIDLSINLFIYLSICLSLDLSIYLSIDLSIYLCIYLSI